LTKRNRNSQRTKEKLLETAEKAFVEKGFDGARVDEIAREAEVNKRMIYVFFGSKEQLYVEVLKNAFRRLFSSGRPELDPNASPLAEIEESVRWYFWFLSDNPSFVRLLGWETLRDGSRAGKVLLDLMEEGLGPLQSMVKRGKEQGFFKSDLAVHKIVTICTEMCLGFFSRIKFFEVLWDKDLNDRKNQEEMIEHIIKILRDGICVER
jgi:AcrR family transcriptional regulator